MTKPKDEKIYATVPHEIWEWIESRTWHNSDWERFKETELPKATKISRALLLLWAWMRSIPTFNERKGAKVIIQFETEDQAITFCSMLANQKERRK